MTHPLSSPAEKIYTGRKASSAAAGSPLNRRQRLRHWLRQRRPRRRTWLILFSLSLLSLAAAWAIRDALRGPRFYANRLRLTAEAAETKGDDFEQSLAQLHNDLQRIGPWQLEINQQQLNGWLAEHLPRKFPQALPDEVVEPRVAIDPAAIRVAFKTPRAGWQPVIVIRCECFLTDQPNVVAVKLKNLRCGPFPLPTTPWTGRVAAAAGRKGLKVRWTQDEGAPLALVTFPAYLDAEQTKALHLTHIEQDNGRLIIHGEVRQRE